MLLPSTGEGGIGLPQEQAAAAGAAHLLQDVLRCRVRQPREDQTAGHPADGGSQGASSMLSEHQDFAVPCCPDLLQAIAADWRLARGFLRLHAHAR